MCTNKAMNLREVFTGASENDETISPEAHTQLG